MLINERSECTRKPLNLNFSPTGRYAKSLMWGSLNVQTYIRPPSFMEVVSLTRNEYPHFNPAKYDVQVKIAKVRSGSHCLHNINYHFVWIPKYRKKLLTGKVRDILAQIIEGQCEELGLQLLALEVMPDHIHLFVGATPTHRPFEIVKKIKGNTSIQLRRVFPDLKFLGYQNHWKRFDALWAIGYYVGSAGHVSQDSVKRYILEQEGKDVFEYSIYGDSSGQTKIGDFSSKSTYKPVSKSKGLNTTLSYIPVSEAKTSLGGN